VRSSTVVEVKVSSDAGFGRADILVGMQVNLFVFDRAPQPFHEHVVAPTTAAVHTDRDLVFVEQTSEGIAGELRALVSVEDFRFAKAGDRLFDRFDTEVGGQRVRNPPREYPPRGPVHNRREVDEAALHRQIGDIHGPDLVRSLDGEVAQQVRIDPVGRMPLAGIGFAVQRGNAHLRHQRADVQSAGVGMPFAREDLAQLSRAEKRVFQVQLVDGAHQRQIVH